MDLINEYIELTKLVSHQINTYNDFATRAIQSIVNREPVVECATHTVKFGHVWIDKPKFIYSDRSVGPLFPNDARKKNISYDGVCYVNVTVCNLETKTEKVHTRIPIGRVPVMVRSGLCNLTEHNKIEKEECSNDPGGYFIVKGKERALVGQLRPVYNKVFVSESKTEERNKFTYTAEMRSMNAQGVSVLVQAKIDKKNRMWFSLPYIKNIVPAGLVFKALNVDASDMLIFSRVSSEAIREGLKDQYDLEKTPEDAIEFIASGLCSDQDATYVKTILTNEIFYHIGKLTEKSIAVHLGFILKQLVDVSTGNKTIDDKYNLCNKRLDSTANLIGFLFQGLFKQFVKTVVTQLKLKKNPDPITIIKSINVITYGLNTCFMTGNWATQKSTSTYTRVGVSQVLSVQNYGARLSHLRRIMLPNGTKGRNPAGRQLHSSHFSFMCPYETPEGETVGLVLNLALTADVTVGIPTCEIEPIVRAFKSMSQTFFEKWLIVLNGIVIGSCANAFEFVKEFETYRKSDTIDNHVSIAWLRESNEIHICSDAGRLIRPLFKVGTDNALEYVEKTPWQKAVADSTIVFRDVWELEQSVVAMDESDLKRNKCDYMEICPAGTMMGIMASVIPFSNHSQSPRNAYQASMGKQAIGIPSEAYLTRYDTTLHVLDYPQTPLTKSSMVNVIKFNEMSHGAMPIVAIMTHCGFNQEDSVILNKASIERGLFSAHTYKTIVEEERKRGNSDFETVCAPKYEYRKRENNYEHMGPDGIVKRKMGIFLKQGDVVIGKTSNRMVKREGDDGSNVRELKTTDVSVTIKQGEEGYLDSVVDTINNEGVRIIKIRVRIPRFPEIGDKFASSTAQKGTCGMIYAQEDMPFDKNGVVPDLIMNPHAIPSRMTINMLIEMCLNLVGCETGSFSDATAFAHRDIEGELQTHLEKLGWSGFSSTLYSGFTGERFPSKIFMAPAFYQRLKHMVSDKIHSRVAGPLDTLTHQPVAGRSRDGGLRFGEMERDAMLAHGSVRILKECLFDQSDKYVINVCKKCGRIPHIKTHCHVCDDSDIETKTMPYATKLLYQELMGMGIKIKIS